MGKNVWAGLVVIAAVVGIIWCLRRDPVENAAPIKNDPADQALTPAEVYVPINKDIPPDEARRLYERCNSDMHSSLVGFGHPKDQVKHPGLQLGTRRGNSKNKFGELFGDTQRRLIGVIMNDSATPMGDEIGDDWKTTPARVLCVFMGGDSTGLFAYVVWEKNGLFTGRIREVAARFRTDAHGSDMAKWDAPIEDRGQVTYDLVPNGLTRDWLSREGGPGTWYTCATNTCCKVM